MASGNIRQKKAFQRSRLSITSFGHSNRGMPLLITPISFLLGMVPTFTDSLTNKWNRESIERTNFLETLMVEGSKAIHPNLLRIPFFVYWAINMPHYSLIKEREKLASKAFYLKIFPSPRPGNMLLSIPPLDEVWVGNVLDHLEQTGPIGRNTIFIVFHLIFMDIVWRRSLFWREGQLPVLLRGGKNSSNARRGGLGDSSDLFPLPWGKFRPRGSFAISGQGR